MERDFLEINGKDLVALVKMEESRRKLHDSGSSAAAQWPLPNKFSALPQLMRFKSAPQSERRDEKFCRSKSNTPSFTAQLTIFYDGAVNVYDDVPLDKAQEIMILASSNSNSTSNNEDEKTKVLVLDPSMKQMQDQNRSLVASRCSGLSSPICVTSSAVARPGNGSNNIDDTKGTVSVGPLKTIGANVGSLASNPLMPRAIPQARKASLARFLEKRKERVTNCMPYSYNKNSPEGSVQIHDAINSTTKSTSLAKTLTSNK